MFTIVTSHVSTCLKYKETHSCFQVLILCNTRCMYLQSNNKMHSHIFYFSVLLFILYLEFPGACKSFDAVLQITNCLPCLVVTVSAPEMATIYNLIAEFQFLFCTRPKCILTELIELVSNSNIIPTDLVMIKSLNT